MAGRELLPSIWVTTFVHLLPFTAMSCLLDSIGDGTSWDTLAEVVIRLLCCALFSPAWANWRARSLTRRARKPGIPVDGGALHDAQTHTVTGLPSDLIRTELGEDGRASDLKEADGGNTVRFRWRPFALFERLSSHGSLIFDEASREARVEVRAGERLKHRVTLHQGAAFIALCQIVECLESADATRRVKQ
ncbi:hypothetical protein ACFVU0_22170 [Streptomyces sp. NPDC058122]|uniref:hypothetical protein n=1 Tax=Streptomyces sp. NPDC058122 TaxID=3346349 RepID=UPI0036EB7218